MADARDRSRSPCDFCPLLNNEIQYWVTENRGLEENVRSLRREIRVYDIVAKGTDGALVSSHKRIERLEAENKELQCAVKQLRDRVDLLEARPKPAAPMPEVTLAALGILCNRQQVLELERLRLLLAEKDATIQRLRSELEGSLEDVEP